MKFKGFLMLSALIQGYHRIIGGGYSDESYKPPPPKKISRKTAMRMTNQKPPRR